MSDEISLQHVTTEMERAGLCSNAIKEFPSEVKPIKDWKSSHSTTVTENKEAIPKQERKDPEEALQAQDDALIHPLPQPNGYSSGYQLPFRTKAQLHELFGAKSIPTAETVEARDIEVALVHPLGESSGEPNLKRLIV